MTGGVVVGGWEYVWMAYGLTFGALILYGVTMVSKIRQEMRKESGEPK